MKEEAAKDTEVRISDWKNSPVLRIGGAYLVVAWGFVQVCEFALDTYDVEPFVLQAITNTLIALFPVVLVLAKYTRISQLVLPDADVPLRSPDVATDNEADEILRLKSAALEFPVALSERRSITTIACSVRGVRDGRDDPELLIGVLPAVESEIHSIVDRYEGTRLASGRNEIVIAFGYPIMHEDDVRRAAKTALEIIALLHAQDRDDDPGTLIVSQAGLHTDVVIIDDAAEESDPVNLLGDNTTIAEWLQTFAPDNGVAVSKESAGLLKNFFNVDELSRFSHPRLGQDVPVFGLGLEYTAQMQQVIAGGDDELVGRDLEYQMLLDHSQTVLDGESQYVLLFGEPGIGKSTLLYRTIRGLITTQSPQLVAINCESYNQGSALRPIISYFERRLFDNDYTMPHPQRLEKLQEFLHSLPVDTDEALPLLAKLLSIESDDPDLTVDESSRLVREKTLKLLVDLLHALAQSAPLLLVIEDLQWADPSTTDLIERLLTDSPESRIYGLFTSRPEFQTEWGRFSHVFAINLSRLPNRVTEDMIRRKLGDETISDTMLQRIIKESGGIPLYIDELIRGLRQSDNALDSDDPESLTIPASLQATLAARVDRLGASKSLLQLCSVIGHEFSYPLLRKVVKSDNEKLLRKVLAELVKESMLYQKGAYPEVTYKFKHRLLMDAAYLSLIKKTQQQLHGSIAATLEESFPDLCATFPVRLAQHFDRSGNAEKAVYYRIRAAQRAQQQFANNEALAQLERGFDALANIKEREQREFSELALQNLKGSVLLASQGYTNPDAMVAFERAVELSDSVENSPELFRMMVGLWMYYLIKGDNAQAKVLSARLLQLAEDSGGPPEMLQANYCTGYSVFFAGHLNEALRNFRHAIEFERPDEDYTRQTPSHDDSRVHAHCLLALTLWNVGDAVQAKTELDSALQLAVDIHQPYAQVWSLLQAAWLYHMRGEYPAMLDAAADVVSIGTEKGISFFVPLGLFFQATQHEDAGERLASMTTYHEMTMQTGARAGSTYLKTVIVAEMIRQESFEDAANWLQEIRDLIVETDERLWEGEVLRLEALLKLRRDENAVDAASQLLRDSVALCTRIGNRPFALRSALALHDCSDASAESLALLKEVVTSYAVPDMTSEFVRAEQILASAAEQDNK
jgi:class 3 adenylate cyclase/tetratricopeptide (TPR) repeat protein